ncbi:MAG: hypothetical protein K2K37_08230, partial [Muribaculaceae bacterium]|nr:hypothetical protein [Muribaculaceae bacterium]
IVYQGECIGSQPADTIKESKVEFIKWENGKSFFRLSTNRIQENQKVTSIQCNFEDGIYRFIIMLSPDNWLDPHPFCYQTVDYYIIGLPAGKIKISVSLNSGEIPLEEYNVSLVR